MATPCLDDHQILEEELKVKGELSKNASRILLEALYVARMNRPDIYWAVNTLAREVTRWTKACDRRLHRLVSYIHWTKHWVQTCWVGDPPEDCILALYADASFAGYLDDSKSSTGSVLCLLGPNTFVPITWICKKQSAVSHSSTEAEVIALDAAVRLDGVPWLLFWEEVVQVFGKGKEPVSRPNKDKRCRVPSNENIYDASLNQNKKKDISNIHQTLINTDHVPPSLPPSQGKARLLILEDNEAVVKMIYKGRSPTMRHVLRTFRVDLDWLFERVVWILASSSSMSTRRSSWQIC